MNAQQELERMQDAEPFKLVARYRKARKIANFLVLTGVSVEDVAALGTSSLGRQLVAEKIGGHVPSETTWALVTELVREVIAPDA